MLGTWYLPASPDTSSTNEVSGEVEFDDKTGWKLRIHGNLEHSPHLLDSPNGQPVIWGETLDGKKVSLFDGLRTRHTQFLPPDRKAAEEWIGLNHAIGGTHVNIDTAIKQTDIKLEALEEWAFWATSLDYDYNTRTIEVPENTGHSATVCGAEVNLTCSWSITSSLSSARTARTAAISVIDEVKICDVQAKWVFPLQSLLSFLVLEYTEVMELTVHLLDVEDTITLHYSSPKDTRSNGNWHPVFMLLAYDQLVGFDLDLNTLLNSWFSLTTSYRTAANLIQFLNTDPNMEPSVSLLIAFMAIEAVHRAEFDDVLVPPDRHKERVESIVGIVPDDDRQWVKERLLSSNRKGLRRKLGEVLSLAESTRSVILRIWPDFEKTALKLRNKAVHPAQPGPNDHIKALAIRTGLLWILRHVFLVRLGLSPEQAGGLVGQSQGFLRDCQVLERWYEQT